MITVLTAVLIFIRTVFVHFKYVAAEAAFLFYRTHCVHPSTI